MQTQSVQLDLVEPSDLFCVVGELGTLSFGVATKLVDLNAAVESELALGAREQTQPSDAAAAPEARDERIRSARPRPLRIHGALGPSPEQRTLPKHVAKHHQTKPIVESNQRFRLAIDVDLARCEKFDELARAAVRVRDQACEIGARHRHADVATTVSAGRATEMKQPGARRHV